MSTIAKNTRQEISKEEIWMEHFNFEREWELCNQNKEMMKMKKDDIEKSRRSKINMVFK